LSRQNIGHEKYEPHNNVQNGHWPDIPDLPDRVAVFIGKLRQQ
jgi:hypothetical protein